MRDGAADLRAPVLALAAWAGALLGRVPWPVVGWAVLLAGGTAAALVLRARRPRPSAGSVRGLAAAVLVGAAVLAAAQLDAAALHHDPVARLARQQAGVHLEATVTSDPRTVLGPFGEHTIVRLEVREVEGRGQRVRVAVAVLLVGDDRWEDAELGSRVALTGRLVPSDDVDLAALVTSPSAPEQLTRPSVWWRASAHVRGGIRAAVAHRPDDQRALVPALVDGDDGGLDPDLAEDFRTTGLTHLTAVSGTNLTLVVGFLLSLARWAGVRGRPLHVVAALGIVGYILLARTEPSVLRAAAMGTVGLLAVGTNSRAGAVRGLSVAVVVLLLLQPGLGLSPGFALSVLATAGIVVLAPGWRDALVARRVPRWLAEAVAVPAAAQLACTPVVAGLSGQVSLVAVAANLVVAPVVGPATVLGLAGGLVHLLVPSLGRLLGTGAGLCVGWIVVVARTGAHLPGAAIAWGSGPLALAGLVAACLAVVVLLPWLLHRREHPPERRRVVPRTGLALVLLVVAGLGVRAWLARGAVPDDWVVAMCDVGQGDALVLNAGEGAGVVVDAGPDPDAVDRCLSRLGVGDVPLVVLTHFHADHVDGLPGVLRGRRVGAVWTTSLLDPPGAVRDVADEAAGAGLVPGLPPEGGVRVGGVSLQRLWPPPGPTHPGPGDGSTANDASVVLVAEVGGLRVLLTGDVEPPGQEQLATQVPDLHVDVLKVPHHGSRYQDLAWLESLHAAVALVSVGADNDYGHPAAGTLEALAGTGVDVARTDQDGTVVVLDRDGRAVLDRLG